MKRQIRIGTFETNSSSTHSLVMMSKEKFDKFKKGELFWYDGGVYSKDEILETAKKWDDTLTLENLEEELDGELKTYENYSDGYEDFHQEYTTEKR